MTQMEARRAPPASPVSGAAVCVTGADLISMWGARSRVVFYGAVVLAVVNVGVWMLTEYPSGGLQTLSAVGVLVACGYSLWRVWRQEHTYTY